MNIRKIGLFRSIYNLLSADKGIRSINQERIIRGKLKLKSIVVITYRFDYKVRLSNLLVANK